MVKRLTMRDETAAAPETRSARAGFWKDEDGSFIIFGLMLFVMMLTVGGLGVDFMRFEAQRARLQATLDRAVLAAASLDQKLDRKEVVLDYFAKAGLEDAISKDDIDVVATLTASRVDASAELTVNSTFLKFVGINSLTAPAEGAAEEAASLTEISLVLDVSGSMSWSSYSGNSKMSELQDAARQFSSIVLCDPADVNATENCSVEEGKVSISIVPYNQQVVLGEDILRQYTVSREHDYTHCVTFYDEDFEDDNIAVSTTDELQRTGFWDPRRAADKRANRWNSPCWTDNYLEVMLFETDVKKVRSKINTLQANGNTSIDMGMKWGAAFLDPEAQSVVTNMIGSGQVSGFAAGRPFDYTQRGIEKVIVLMTDGENTDQDYLKKGYHGGFSPIWKANDKGYLSIYDAENDRYWWVTQGKWGDHAYGTGVSEICGWKREWVKYWWGWTKENVWSCEMKSEGSGAYQMSFSDVWKVYPEAWYNQWWFLEDAGDSWGNADKNDRLDKICTAAKAEDIKVFTVGFEVPDYVQDVLRDCATAPAYNFNVNGLNIADAFATIAREISKLRLVN